LVRRFIIVRRGAVIFHGRQLALKLQFSLSSSLYFGPPGGQFGLFFLSFRGGSLLPSLFFFLLQFTLLDLLL
jgi:hypothetical protein